MWLSFNLLLANPQILRRSQTSERGIHALDAAGLSGGPGAAVVLPALSGRSRESEQQEVAVGANTQLFPYVHRSIDGADSPHDRPWV